MLIWLENFIGIYWCNRLAQLSTTFWFQKFPFLWNSGSVMDYVFWNWVFIWKILIWFENVIGIHCCNHLEQLSTTFCFSKFLFLWNSESAMDYAFRQWVFIWKILIWLENVIGIYWCNRLAQLGTTFFFKNSHFCRNPGRWWTMYFENEFSFGKY